VAARAAVEGFGAGLQQQCEPATRASRRAQIQA
jgi:hypothetical protein